jgi:mRNA interferase RelE/StbE
MYKITYRKQAAKALLKLPATYQARFAAAFAQLASGDSGALDIKKLEGREGFRLRIGECRAIYRLLNDALVIEVVKIGSRGDIYK